MQAIKARSENFFRRERCENYVAHVNLVLRFSSIVISLHMAEVYNETLISGGSRRKWSEDTQLACRQ
jgi:hypothetical protein